MSNQDEEEVEDEMAALEAELNRKDEELPSVPNVQLPLPDRESSPAQRTPVKRAKEPMMAA